MEPSDESSHSSLEMEDISDPDDSDFEIQVGSQKRIKQTTSTALGLLPPKRPRRKAAAQYSPNLTPPVHSPQPQPTPRQGSPRPDSPMQGSPRRASTRHEGRGSQGTQGISAGDMYEAVRSGKSAMVTVVDEWLDSYKQDQEAGLLMLINFVVQCCGCKGVVSKEMFDTMQKAEIIGTLTKEFNEESATYPLSSPGPEWKRFKADLCEFFRVLVQACQNSLLYDEYLFAYLLALLTGLSDSQVRAFRHTSTLIAMKVMTAVVGVAVTVFAQLKTTQRRFDLERNKMAPDRAPGRLEELQATTSQLREHQEELSDMMNATFRGVFVHRYRDRVPEIRALCMEEMGVWMRENPQDYLNDGYLKYLGWSLHDKQGSVRLQCVRALQGLYQEKDFIGRLELFTSRFKARMLNMMLDKDPDVAVEVVQLLLLIHQRTEEGLTEEECSHVYPLVFASHKGLASAAGAFLYHKLCSAVTRDTNEADHGSRRAAFLNILVSFYIQSEFHEHGSYLVDSLWAVAGAELRDWETMTSLLLQEADPGQGLSDVEEGALIELMMCAVRQAAEGVPPVGRTQGKKLLSKKDKVIQDRRRITTHFIPLLPQLLAKYSADVEKVTSLLKAPLLFDLETYSTGRLEKHLDMLLAQVCGIVEKHTDAGVLEACARLLCALYANHYTFSTRADLAVSQLLDGLTEHFTSYFNDLLQGTAAEEDTYGAANALKRIAAFSSAKDLTSWKLFEPCYKLLKSGLVSRDVDKELMVAALKCAAFHLFWERVKASNSTPTEGELECLKTDVRSFCRVCQSCLSVGCAEIRDQAFELLCDLLLLFGLGSVGSQPSLQTLAHPPSDMLRAEMVSFLLDYVFTEEGLSCEEEGEEEVKIAALRQRRNQLAGYCKLVIYGVLDLSAATDILKYYSKFYNEYGDIIKDTLSKTKLISSVQSAKTVCLCLQQLFSALAPEERCGLELGEIRELAKRLAMNFGVTLQPIRKPLIALHMDGIWFAFREAADGEQPPNLAFLEILSEFSFKLLRRDRFELSEFLKGECVSAASSWLPLRMYQRSLQTGSSSKTKKDAQPPNSAPTAKRKRTALQDLVSRENSGSWLDSSSIHSNLPTPTLTSTVQRGQPKLLPASGSPGSTTGSDKGSIVAEPESDDDFSEGSVMRRVSRPPPSLQPSPSLEQCDLDSHLTILSLIEEDEEEEEEEPQIEDFESDSSSDFALPSTRHSTSHLEELFQ